MTDEQRFTVGSGNIYADLGFSEPEIEQTKAHLARQIAAIIQERRLTQVQAAAILGIDQPKVSALLRGRLGGFTADRLMRLITRLDFDVDISTRPKSDAKQPARITVHPTTDVLEPLVASPTDQSKAGVHFS